VAVAAGVICLTLAGAARQSAVFYLATMFLGVNAMMWIIWAVPTVSLDTKNSTTPVPRTIGSLVLLSALVAPLLIEPLLARRRQAPAGAPARPAPETPASA
jgi:hypothetical protein